MRTIQTKPTNYLSRKLFVMPGINNGTLRPRPKSLQNHLKNIITSPE
ncbi:MULTISPECIES: hypothetical protein [Olivibacter]|uniref:Uncharacterized protein n=2 Tax=Olivibacter TaxID=376469 RepID=A0ABV6HGE0_9SPHI|nr:hypothetical protein [Olivibacter jilunii]